MYFMRRRFLASVGLLFSALTLLLTSGLAYAATPATNTVNGSGNALRISPVRYDLSIKPGAQQTVQVVVTNLRMSNILIVS